MDFYHLEEKEVLDNLNSDKNGLTKQEAKSRLEKYGSNLIQKKKKISAIKIFISQFKSFIVYIILAALVISLILNEPKDAIVIGIIIIINAVFGFIQEYKAEKSIEALKRLGTPEAVVLRDNEEVKISSSLLVPGDIIILEAGQIIPADCYLLEAIELKVDESTLTGESVPVKKEPGIVKKDVLVNDRTNMLFSSTLVTYGRARAIVVKTGMKTELGKIANLIQDQGIKDTPLQKKLNKLGMILGWATIVIALVVLLTGVIRGIEFFEMLRTSVSLAVAAIPEGLPAVVTIALALGVKRMIKKRVLIRKLSAVETLGSTTVIAADKTGTLTENKMTVTKIFANNKLIKVTGLGHSLRGDFLYEDKKYDIKKLDKLMQTSLLCNNSKLSHDKVIGDPTELAILIAGKKSKFHVESKRIKEIPFSSKNKYMLTLDEINGKHVVHIKGAPEVIVKNCSHILIDGKKKILSEKDKENLLKENNNLAEQALRVIALAYNPQGHTKNLTFLGLMGMIDPPRMEVKDSINLCKKAGIKVVMITGDHKITATAIASQLGIGSNALTGEELDKLSEEEFEKIVNKIDIYARVSPEHKVKILIALKKKDNIVAMTGDGVNDAPALKMADIGIAVNSGTDVAKEASDMVLTDDNFTSIVSAVEEGRHIYSDIKKFVKYLLSSNTGEVFTIFFAILIGLKLPLTAIQLLWMNLVTDGFPALALGVEPIEKDTMLKPPRNPKEKILSKSTGYEILLVGLLMSIGTLFLFYTYLGESLAYAQTMAFTTLVVFQMFNVFNNRSDKSLFKINFFSNKKLLLAVSFSMFLQFLIIYTPLSEFFGTTFLTLMDWVYIVLIGFSVILLIEIKKYFTNRKKTRF